MTPEKNNLPTCRKWECYQNAVWMRFWQIVTLLFATALGIAVGLLTSGCAFSIPISDRVRCDIQINAQLVNTEPLPTIWLDK